MGHETALKFAIRPASLGDEAQLMTVAMRSWRIGIKPIVKQERGLDEREMSRFGAHIARFGDRVIAAYDGDRVIGWIGRSRSPNYVAFFFVDPEFQNLGVGSALLARQEAIAELQGYEHLWLDTFARRDSALSFYLKRGYGPASEEDEAKIVAPKSRYTGVRLVKALSISPLEFDQLD